MLFRSGFDTKSLDGLFGKNDLKFKLPDLPDGPKNMKLPDWKGPSWGGSTPSMPSAPSFGGGWSMPGFGGLSGGGASAAVPVLIVIGLIVAAVLAWWLWPQIRAARAAKAQTAIALPKNFDPRNVNDRESLVKAFEIVSLILCGDGAKVWNHDTIATALRELIANDPEGIDRLAVLYALARYTPAGESLHPDSVKEARRILCQLAGVPET